MSLSPRSPRKSQSARSKLTLPVAKVGNRMREVQTNAHRLAGEVPTYATGLLEFVGVLLLDKAADVAQESGRDTVTASDVCAAIQGDVDLNEVFHGVKLKLDYATPGDRASDVTVEFVQQADH
jgi:histone H3/H4